MKKVKSPKNLEEAIEIIAVLQKEITTLKELLGLNSLNSSLPPSQDRTKKKKLTTGLVAASVVAKWGIKESQEDY